MIIIVTDTRRLIAEYWLLYLGTHCKLTCMALLADLLHAPAYVYPHGGGGGMKLQSARGNVVPLHTALKNLGEAWAMDRTRVVMHNTIFRFKVMLATGILIPGEISRGWSLFPRYTYGWKLLEEKSSAIYLWGRKFHQEPISYDTGIQIYQACSCDSQIHSIWYVQHSNF